MEDIKEYYPATISDNSIYNPTSESSTTTTVDGSVQKPPVTPGSQMPILVNAKELINESFDTQSRRILSDYSFSESGSLKIGKYVSGVQGEIAISPNGIVAKNSSGDTTFAIDGTTGNATFKGTVLAGSVIAGTISADNIVGGTLKLGGSSNVNGIAEVYDGTGTLSAQFNKDALEFYGTGLAGIAFYDASTKGSFYGAFGYSSSGNISLSAGATANKTINIHADGSTAELNLYTVGTSAPVNIETSGGSADINLNSTNYINLTATNGIWVYNNVTFNNNNLGGVNNLAMTNRGSNPSTSGCIFIKNKVLYFKDPDGSVFTLS